MPSTTVLILDVHGWDRLHERRPEASSLVGARLDELLDDVVPGAGGRVLREPCHGSTRCCVFGEPRAAAEAARGLTETVAAEAWPPGVPVFLRMAIDSDAQACAALLELAAPGRVLLSARVGASVEATVEVAEGVHELVWDGRRPRILGGAALTRIPKPPTPFVGRAADVTAVVRLVRSASRLVTIVGPEGIGKTRLAYRAAEEMAPSFPDGVSVQGPPDPGSAASAVPDGSRMLLVWDGCEDTAEACAAAAIDLLRRAPDVHVLATSRHPLGVPGESVWRIGPLSEADAVKLFCERAGVPQLDENVRRICRETGGHPLVVEAVAANHPAANHPA